MEQKGKAERCLMPENNMAGKIFSLLYVCWGLDVNVGFGLKAEGKRFFIQVFEQRTDSG